MLKKKRTSAARHSLLHMLALCAGVFVVTRFEGVRTLAESYVHPPVAYVLSTISNAHSWWQNQWARYTGSHDAQTTHTLAHLQAQLAQAHAQLKRYESTLALLDTDVISNKHTMVTADVVTRPSAQHMFFVRVGHTKNIRAGMPVVSPLGVVGYIDALVGDLARVIPLTHYNSRLPVVSLETGEQAMLIGQVSGPPKIMRQKSSDKLIPGERFVTSAYGGLFPYGIPVGQTKRVAEHTEFSLYVDWEHLHSVTILTHLGDTHLITHPRPKRASRKEPGFKPGTLLTTRTPPPAAYAPSVKHAIPKTHP